MKSCLMLTSNDLPNTPSEAQEIINILDRDSYKVHLLQSNVSSLELYRTLERGPFTLVWVACHSGEAGFQFGGTIIAPNELGQFLEEAQAENLVLNSCFSAQHVNIIQEICNVNVVATINPTVDDSVAWSSALYLASALRRTGSLYEAYRSILSGKGSQYRWFPALRSRKGVMVNDAEPNLQKLEKTLERIAHIMYGDQILHAPGLIQVVDELRNAIKEHIESDEKWKRETEVRMRILEASSPGNTIVLTRQTVRLLLTFLIIAIVFLFFVVYLLKG